MPLDMGDLAVQLDAAKGHRMRLVRKATVCRPCNENKSARSLAEFLPIRALVGTYRPTDCADHARIQP